MANSKGRKALLCSLLTVLAGSAIVGAVEGGRLSNMRVDGTSAQSKAVIYFGGVAGSTSSSVSTLTNTSAKTYYTVTDEGNTGFGVDAMTGTRVYKKPISSSYSTAEALKFGTTSSAGSFTVTFNGSYAVKAVEVTSWRYSSKDAAGGTFALTGNGTTGTIAGSATSAPSSLSATTDAGSTYITTFDVSGTAESTGFTIKGASGSRKRFYLAKVVLTLETSAAESTSSEESSVSSSETSSTTEETSSSSETSSSTTAPSSTTTSSSTSSSTASSSSTETPVSTGTYSLVTSASQLVAGNKYIVGSAQTAGTAYFLGNSQEYTYYVAGAKNTINSDISVTPTSTTEVLTLGGNASAWTFMTSKRTTNGYLTGDSYYSDFIVKSSPSSYYTYTIALSGGEATVKNVDNGRYMSFDTSYDEYELASSSTTVNLYVEGATSVKAPSLTLGASTLSLTAGQSATTINATTDSDATITASSNKTSVATVAVSGTAVKVTPVAAGTAAISVTATNGEASTTKTCAVTVLAAATPTVALSASTLTMTGSGATDNSIAVSCDGFSGTPSYTVTSTNSVLTGAVTNGQLVLTLGTISASSSATITVKGTYLSETSSATVKVTIAYIAPVTAIAITGADSVQVGGSITLTATVTGGTAKTVTWKSSSTAKATVNASGVVTGVAAGTAVITATSTENTAIVATKTITVNAKTMDDYTIMIYMCGSNLESDYASSGSYSSYTGLATGNISEILSVTYPDGVNVILETGGCKAWETTYGISASKLGRYHVANGALVQDASLTNASMGKTATFQSFLEWGLQSYPAQHTGVIMWDHGGAMQGCCYDENYSDDSLYNSEVHAALKNAFSTVGRTEKLDWIGYDCCLMAVQDIADFNGDYFNYMVSSQESEPGEGWDYDTWLGALAANTSMTTLAIGTKIADSFVSKCKTGGSTDATMSVLDLSKSVDYRTKWEAMASDLSSVITSSSKWTTFKTLCKSCLQFGKDSTYGYTFDIFDLSDWCDAMQSSSTFSGVDTVDAVETAMSSYIVYNKYGTSYSSNTPCGLNLFAPVYGYTKKAAYTTSDTNFTTWRTLAINYGSFYS